MNRKCFVCSGAVSRNGSTGRFPRFCSSECRQRARALRAQAARHAAYEAQAIRDRETFRAVFGLDAA